MKKEYGRRISLIVTKYSHSNLLASSDTGSGDMSRSICPGLPCPAPSSLQQTNKSSHWSSKQLVLTCEKIVLKNGAVKIWQKKHYIPAAPRGDWSVRRRGSCVISTISCTIVTGTNKSSHYSSIQMMNAIFISRFCAYLRKNRIEKWRSKNLTEKNITYLRRRGATEASESGWLMLRCLRVSSYF